jgi:hypothetical protein
VIDSDAIGDTIAVVEMVSDRYYLTYFDFSKASRVPEIGQSNSLSADSNFCLAGRLVGIDRPAWLRVAAECLGDEIDSCDDALRIESRGRRHKHRKHCNRRGHQQFGHRRASILKRSNARYRRLVYGRWVPKGIAIWLSGYYHGKRGASNFEPQTFKANFDKLKSACYLKENYNLPVMQVIEKTLGTSK